MFTWSEFFTDPVLRAPTLGAMMMSLCCALVGVVAFVQRRSLIGETLSHAAYPGIALGCALGAFFGFLPEEGIGWWGILGGGASALLGLFAIEMLEKRGTRADSALCFVLALFLGLGVLIASRLQLTHALWYKGIRAFLYGQVATMRAQDLTLYALFTVSLVVALALLFPRMKMIFFDRNFARGIGLDGRWQTLILNILFVAAVVIGMRSIGIVLMAGMLVAPAVAARQWTTRFSTLFFFAGIIGVVSAFLGQYLSVQLPRLLNLQVSLATGPMIVLSAISFAFFSLLFAPRRGFCARTLRAAAFRRQCERENLLKFYWKRWQDEYIPDAHWKKMGALMRHGFVTRDEKGYRLTIKGRKEAARIVRVHRLWEVYLDDLGLHGDSVHENAAEMEHIISDEFEDSLAQMLGDPKKDPHNQPIPEKGEY